MPPSWVTFSIISSIRTRNRLQPRRLYPIRSRLRAFRPIILLIVSSLVFLPEVKFRTARKTLFSYNILIPGETPFSTEPANELQQPQEYTPCRHCQGKLKRIANEVRSKTDGLNRVGDELRNIDRELGNFTRTLSHIKGHIVRMETIGAAVFAVRVVAPVLSDLYAAVVG